MGLLQIFVLNITPVVYGSLWNEMYKGDSSELQISQLISLLFTRGLQSTKKGC